MRVVSRVLAVAVGFTLLAGGGFAVSSVRTRTQPVAAAEPIVAPAPTQAAPSRPADPSVPATPSIDPTPEPVQPAPAGKLIEVSIEDQELIAWQDGIEVYRFVVSTGRPGYETPTGRFKIHTKYDNRWSRTWKVWMPYAMFWHPRYGYAFHELPYKSSSPGRRIGKSRLGRADSHGCVRVNLGDAKTLYEWAPIGTAVWVH